jgi:hypothetical protein
VGVTVNGVGHAGVTFALPLSLSLEGEKRNSPFKQAK